MVLLLVWPGKEFFSCEVGGPYQREQTLRVVPHTKRETWLPWVNVLVWSWCDAWLFPRWLSGDHPGQNLPTSNWTLCCAVLSKWVRHPGEVSPPSSDPSLGSVHPQTPSPRPGDPAPLTPSPRAPRPQRGYPLALQFKAGSRNAWGSNPRSTTGHWWAIIPHPQGPPRRQMPSRASPGLFDTSPVLGQPL